MPISYGRWRAYPWKNELVLQRDRVAVHFREMLDEDFVGEHSPLDMLDRALVLSGFVIRRMFEKRLVTDKLAAQSVRVRTYKSKQDDFRPPFLGYSGGHAFHSYDFEVNATEVLTINDLANEIIHSAQLMVVENEPSIPSGFLIASDWRFRKRLIHLTMEEFMAISQQVLDDFVHTEHDEWHPETGEVHAKRE